MNSETDSKNSKEPKDREEVAKQEQQQIEAESKQGDHTSSRSSKDRGEVAKQEQQQIEAESKKVD